MNRFAAWQRVLGTSLQDLVYSIREKGIKHFARALMLAGIVVFLTYLLSNIPAAQLTGIESGIAAVQASAQYADRYKALEETLRNISSNLPDPKNQDTWLQDRVVEAMKEEGISFTSLTPKASQEQGTFNIVAVTVECNARYAELARWVARMERSKGLLYISDLSIAKNTQNNEKIGVNRVTVTINTVVPKVSGRL